MLTILGWMIFLPVIFICNEIIDSEKEKETRELVREEIKNHSQH